MPDVLGVVPTVGRGWIVHEVIAGSRLDVNAVAALEGLADPPVMVVTGPRQQWIREALAAHSPAVDLAESPGDDARVRGALVAAEVVIIHDPLCPLVPAGFIRELLARALAGVAVVGVRPVVDTVKATIDGAVSGTVDRDTLCIVSSPIVLPGARLAAVVDVGSALRDLSSLVQLLRAEGDVELVAAPSASRRIEDRSGLALLASVDAVGHRLRERG